MKIIDTSIRNLRENRQLDEVSSGEFITKLSSLLKWLISSGAFRKLFKEDHEKRLIEEYIQKLNNLKL